MRSRPPTRAVRLQCALGAQTKPLGQVNLRFRTITRPRQPCCGRRTPRNFFTWRLARVIRRGRSTSLQLWRLSCAGGARRLLTTLCTQVVGACRAASRVRIRTLRTREVARRLSQSRSSQRGRGPAGATHRTPVSRMEENWGHRTFSLRVRTGQTNGSLTGDKYRLSVKTRELAAKRWAMETSWLRSLVVSEPRHRAL